MFAVASKTSILSAKPVVARRQARTQVGSVLIASRPSAFYHRDVV